MRRFESVQFPTSDAFITPFLVLNRFPKDVGLAVMEHCSPYDLTQLSLTSRFLRSFISANKHLWTAGRFNLARRESPRLPAPPVVEANGNYSQSAYAFWWCSVWTNSQPVSFLFRLRSCSATCKALLMSDASLRVDKAKKYDDFSWGKWLPRGQQVHQLLNGQIIYYVYSRRATDHAERERQQAIGVDAGNSRGDPLGFPRRTVQQLNAECALRQQARDALAKNACELDIWQQAYFAQRVVVSQKNFEFLKLMSTVEDQKVQAVLRCPTAARLCFAFNRDLAYITYTVWTQHRTGIFSELKFMLEGVFPTGMEARYNDKKRCSYCPRLIKTQGPKSGHHPRNPKMSAEALPRLSQLQAHLFSARDEGPPARNDTYSLSKVLKIGSCIAIAFKHSDSAAIATRFRLSRPPHLVKQQGPVKAIQASQQHLSAVQRLLRI
ncbi:hypothetical protein DFH09DRAFT_1089344 [Mycena vulgaris]|nr:hypothetical protein DFH09DRAFT_1089344 [Mycena vulgaris]